MALIDIDVTGELLTQVVSAYSRTSLPSALLKRVAHALDIAAEGKGQRDADLLCSVATDLRSLSDLVRSREDDIYNVGVNVEGITFEEWRAATGIEFRDAVIPNVRKAWKDGEDPTEWRASFLGNK